MRTNTNNKNTQKDQDICNSSDFIDFKSIEKVQI